MTITDLAFNKRVVWRNLPGIIIDIRWGHNPRALVRIAGGWQHWVAPEELSEGTGNREQGIVKSPNRDSGTVPCGLFPVPSREGTMKEALPERDLFGGRPGEYALPDYAQPTKCASCGAAMAFVKTPNGKAMPLSLATIEERDGQRLALPHFADCPQAKEWSKKR